VNESLFYLNGSVFSPVRSLPLSLTIDHHSPPAVIVPRTEEIIIGHTRKYSLRISDDVIEIKGGRGSGAGEEGENEFEPI
jgi:hypothetical protein